MNIIKLGDYALLDRARRQSLHWVGQAGMWAALALLLALVLFPVVGIRLPDDLGVILAMQKRESAVAGLAENIPIGNPTEKNFSYVSGAFNISVSDGTISSRSKRFFNYHVWLHPFTQLPAVDNFAYKNFFQKFFFGTYSPLYFRNDAGRSSVIVNDHSPRRFKIFGFRPMSSQQGERFFLWNTIQSATDNVCAFVRSSGFLRIHCHPSGGIPQGKREQSQQNSKHGENFFMDVSHKNAGASEIRPIKYDSDEMEEGRITILLLLAVLAGICAIYAFLKMR